MAKLAAAVPLDSTYENLRQYKENRQHQFSLWKSRHPAHLPTRGSRLAKKSAVFIEYGKKESTH
jgi:hypothetical protein